MSIEAHKCNVQECKGFIVFESADFNIANPPTVDGMYEFDNPSCTECGKEFKVVPSYTVIAIDEHGDVEDNIKSVCITAFERREVERKFDNETDPYKKIQMFIQMRGYSYSIEDVVEGYQASKRNAYLSYTMKDCVTNLSDSLKSLA